MVTDERRRNRPKGARRFAVAAGSPSDSVASLDRVPDSLCVTLLAEKLPEAIPVVQSNVIWL